MSWKATKPSDTRYTSFYADLWHRDFVLLLLSLTLLSAAIVMLLCNVGDVMNIRLHSSKDHIVYSFLSFGAGIIAVGPFISWLTERYRRNKVYIVSTLLLTVMMFVVFFLDEDYIPKNLVCEAFMWCVSFLCGAFYGVAMRLLIGVLIIDKCESYNRTEANHVSMWTTFVAFVVALLLVRLVYNALDDSVIGIVACSLALIAALIVAFLPFPFRTPTDEVSIVSLDRFLMLQGGGYSLSLLFSTVVAAYVLSSHNDVMFYAMLLFGFVVVMLTHCIFKEDSTARREVLVGIALMLVSLLTTVLYSRGEVFVILSSLLISMAFGYVSIGVMKQLLGASSHCKRSTVVCSHFMTIAIGSLIGFCIALYQL